MDLLKRVFRKICATVVVTTTIIACMAAGAYAGDPYEIIQVVDGTYVGSVQSNTVIIETPETPLASPDEVVVEPPPAVETPIAVHTVSFLDWYGRALGSVQVRNGEGVAAPENPPHIDGQTFAFWFDEAGSRSTPYAFGSPVTGDLRLIPYYRDASQPSVQTPSTPADNSGVPQMPKLPDQVTITAPQAVSPDAAKQQASHFINEMVKALEPTGQSAIDANSQRIAHEITQIATPEPPMTNEDAMAIVGDIIQGSDAATGNNGGTPSDILVTLPVEPEQPTETPPAPTPTELDPLTLIETINGGQSPAADATDAPEEPTAAPVEPSDVLDMLGVEPTVEPEPLLPEPVLPELTETEAPQVTETPPEESTPPAQETEPPAAEPSAPVSQPDKPLTLEELLGGGQQQTAPPVAMSEQQAMDLVNDILSEMDVNTVMQEEQVDEIIELLGENRTEEATEIVEEILQDPAATEQPAADPTSPPWEGQMQAEPYVVATYHYEGELTIGTPVTVRANVYNLPEGQRLSYQWQSDKNGVFEDVPGATGQTHTFVADEHGLSGSSWRVNVMLED